MVEEDRAPSWQVTKSVLAAGFGVQSNENRERDFKYGKPGQFIIIGLIITVLFILGVWGLVLFILGVWGLVMLVMNLAGV
jgi:hypothetical protein